jgi:hypothetical protein
MLFCIILGVLTVPKAANVSGVAARRGDRPLAGEKRTAPVALAALPRPPKPRKTEQHIACRGAWSDITKASSPDYERSQDSDRPPSQQQNHPAEIQL